MSEAFVSFLDEWTRRGPCIDAIYFDGLLPSGKETTRQARLDRSLQGLIGARARYFKGLSLDLSTGGRHTAYKARLFRSERHLSSTYKGLPALPFLVPTILEALYCSRYASLMKVVPGEADTYCAQSTVPIGHELVILTSDSDMLVHPLNDGSKVAFLSELQLVDESDDQQGLSCEVLKISAWCPGEIAEELGLRDLCLLAFHVKQNPHVRLTEAARMAKQTKKPLVHNEDLAFFLEEYTSCIADIEKDSFDTVNLKAFLTHGSAIDSRLAEVLLRLIMKLGSPRSQLVYQQANVPCAYLPFLLDNPSRSSAWNVSLSLRRLAYGLIARSTSTRIPCQYLDEYTRKGHRFVAERITLFSSAEEETQANRMIALIKTNEDPNLDASTLWRVIAISQIRRYQVSIGQRPPALASMKASLHGIQGDLWTWDDIHMTAQVQGFLYSMRMIHQTLLYAKHTNYIHLSAIEDELLSLLDILPRIEELIPSNAQVLKRNRDLDTATIATNIIRDVWKEYGSTDAKEFVVGACTDGRQHASDEKGSGSGKGKKSKKHSRKEKTKDRSQRKNNTYHSLEAD